MSKELAYFGGPRVRYKDFPTEAVIGEEEKQAVIEVLNTGNLSGFIGRAGDYFGGGSRVLSLEHSVCDYFGVESCVSMNSATSCLHAALVACGVEAGDEVIVPPYTMSATATAVLMQNAFPVFVDINPDSFCINECGIEDAITEKTKAIIVVHLFGCPADMPAIMKIAKKHNLFVIEDCAQAMGATCNGQFVGTFGDIGVFSFNQHKVVTCGEGGVAITNNRELSFKMSLVRNHGECFIDDMGDEYLHYRNIIGYNYRMTELDAAIAEAQFQKLDYFNLVRIGLAEYLIDKLSGLTNDLWVCKQNYNGQGVYFTLPIQVSNLPEFVSSSTSTQPSINVSHLAFDRDLFVDHIKAEGIPMNVGYTKPLYLMPVFQGRKGGSQKYEKGLCPIAEFMYEKKLMLISVCRHPNKIRDMDDVVRAFEKVLPIFEEFKEIKI